MQSEQDATTCATPPATPDTPVSLKKEKALELVRRGMSYRQVAKQLSVTPSTVMRWARADAMNYATPLRVPTAIISRDDINRKILELAPDCVETVDNLRRTSRKDDVRLRASADLLDRAGFRATDRLAVFHAIEDMDAEQLRTSLANLISAIKTRQISSDPSINVDSTHNNQDCSSDMGNPNNPIINE